MKKSLILLGSFCVIGGGVAYYQYNKKNSALKQEKVVEEKKQENTTQKQNLSEEQIQQYLLKLKDHLFDAHKQISVFVTQISTDLKDTPVEQVQETVSESIQIDGVKIFTEQVFFPNQSSKINVAKCQPIVNKIQNSLRQAQLNSFKDLNLDINEEMFKEVENKIKQYSENNETIKTLAAQIQEDFQKAMKGEEQEIECEIPEKMNPELFFAVTKDIMKKSCYKIQRTFKDNQALNHLNGEIQAKDAAVQKLISELDFSDVKQEVIKSFELEVESEKIDKILSVAEETYKKSDKKFEQNLKRLQNIYNFTFEACIYQADNEELVESFFQRFQLN